MMDRLTQSRQRGAVAQLIGNVEGILAADVLGPRLRAQTLLNASVVCAEFGFSPIRQDNISEPDLDASLQGVQAAMTEDAR